MQVSSSRAWFERSDLISTSSISCSRQDASMSTPLITGWPYLPYVTITRSSPPLKPRA